MQEIDEDESDAATAIRHIESFEEDEYRLKAWLRTTTAVQVLPIINGYDHLLMQLRAGETDASVQATRILKRNLSDACALLARYCPILPPRHLSTAAVGKSVHGSCAADTCDDHLRPIINQPLAQPDRLLRLAERRKMGLGSLPASTL